EQRLHKFSARLVQQGIKWYLTRVMNLSTLHREYLSLKMVPNLHLAEELLYGEASTLGGAPRADFTKGDSFNPDTKTSGVEAAAQLEIPRRLKAALSAK